jgi:hypothetical protein
MPEPDFHYCFHEQIGATLSVCSDGAVPLPQLMQAGFGNSGLGEIFTAAAQVRSEKRWHAE